MDLQEFIKFLEMAIDNVWYLMFISVWVAGYMLKNHTSLNNDMIMWVLVPGGGALGLYLIEFSATGFIMGAFIAYAMSGAYEHFKHSKDLLKK